MDRLQDFLSFTKVNSLVGNSIATASLLPEDAYTALGVEGLTGDVMVIEPVLPSGKFIIDIPEVRRFYLRRDDSLQADVITVDEDGRALLGPAFVKCMSKNEFISKYDGKPLYGTLGSISPEKIKKGINTAIGSIPGAGNISSIIDEITQDSQEHVNELMAEYDVDFDATFKKVRKIIKSMCDIQNIVEKRVGSTLDKYSYTSLKTDATAVLTYREPSFEISFSGKSGDINTNAAMLGYCDTEENANEIASTIVKAISTDDCTQLKLTADKVYRMFIRFFELSAEKNGYIVRKVINNGKDKLLVTKSNINDRKVYLTANISNLDTVTLNIDCLGENDKYESGFSNKVNNVKDYTDLLIAGKCISNFFNNYKNDNYNRINNIFPDPLDFDISPEVLNEVHNMYSSTLKANYRAYKIMKAINKLANQSDIIKNEKSAEIVDNSFSSEQYANEICYTLTRHFYDDFEVSNGFVDLFPEFNGIEINGEQLFETLAWRATANDTDLVFKVVQNLDNNRNIKVLAYVYTNGEKFSRVKMYDREVTNSLDYMDDMKETFDTAIVSIFSSFWLPENINKTRLNELGSDTLKLLETLAKARISVTFED